MSQAPDLNSRPMMELRGVTKVFRGDLLRPAQTAIDQLSCAFTRGSCTGLLGPNGAGKTTTIRLILGLLKPDTGTVLLDGVPLTTAAKQRLGYMPEVNKLPGGLTVEEILYHQLQIYRPAAAATRASRRQRVSAVLAEVGLAKHAQKRIAHLSKGMGRRLAWAQATIHWPEVLILDEPASGLDPLGRRQMLEWIGAAKERGTTILLCTHELTQIMTLCDEYHILRGGRLMASGLLAIRAEQGYLVDVSGLDAADLRHLADTAQLPAWQDLQQTGLLAEIAFNQYAAAAAWVQQLLARGYVVTRFGDDRRRIEQSLLRHFAAAGEANDA